MNIMKYNGFEKSWAAVATGLYCIKNELLYCGIQWLSCILSGLCHSNSRPAEYFTSKQGLINVLKSHEKIYQFAGKKDSQMPKISLHEKKKQKNNDNHESYSSNFTRSKY